MDAAGRSDRGRLLRSLGRAQDGGNIERRLGRADLARLQGQLLQCRVDHARRRGRAVSRRIDGGVGGRRMAIDGDLARGDGGRGGGRVSGHFGMRSRPVSHVSYAARSATFPGRPDDK